MYHSYLQSNCCIFERKQTRSFVSQPFHGVIEKRNLNGNKQIWKNNAENNYVEEQ